MKKSTISIVVAVICLIFIIIYASSKYQTESNLIGGQRDEYGCLGPAGYSWSEDIGACVRLWEIETPDQERAAQIAVEHFGEQKGLTVDTVLVARCPGCFEVTLEKYGEKSIIILENWKVTEQKQINIETICSFDEDCIPLPSDCHPTSCINKEYESKYIKPEACTMIFMYEAAYTPEDCICSNNVCTNKNLGRETNFE